MAGETQETFGNFGFSKALEYLELFPFKLWEPEIKPLQPSESLKTLLKRAEKQVTTGSNEWEQRLFMELIFLEALENHNLRMWQEKPLDAGVAPFRGKADFVFTPYQASFHDPYVVLSEAKKDDFEQGWGQCLMAMRAAQLMNEKNNHTSDVYGIVSSGRVWEFGKYTMDNQFSKTEAYSIAQLELLLGVLNQIFTECETSYSK